MFGGIPLTDEIKNDADRHEDDGHVPEEQLCVGCRHLLECCRCDEEALCHEPDDIDDFPLSLEYPDEDLPDYGDGMGDW